MTEDDKPKTHPMQLECCQRHGAQMPVEVTMAAYEVYCHVYGPQLRLVTGDCRGGFGIGELIGLLYARAFPRSEWRDRVNLAFDGMKVSGDEIPMRSRPPR